ncbi:MAG: hypothetical protein NVSMB48_19360 [Marmoricola sp.]
MTALLDTAPIVEFDAAPLDEVTVSELALADLLDRSERLHRSNIQHDPVRCLVCFGVH